MKNRPTPPAPLAPQQFPPGAPATSDESNVVVAMELCEKLYKAMEPFGFYPALTGGCLYKGEKRKDIDVIIYRNRAQNKGFEISDLSGILSKINVEILHCHGFVTKAKYDGFDVDILNPETKKGDNYNEAARND